MRIQKLFDSIVKEIGARDEINQAAELFSALNIAENGMKTVIHMEWNGGKVSDQELVAAATLDSDDDEDAEIDPLKIIAQSRDTVKLVKVVKPEKTLITEADLEDIRTIIAENEKNKSQNDVHNTSTRTDDSNKTIEFMELEPHAIYMIKKDKAFDKDAIIRQKFLPFKTTKSDVHDVEKEKLRKHSVHWEITAATPPNLRNNAVKMIPLHESIEMERQHNEKLREQMEQHAEGRLAMRQKLIEDNISLLPSGSTLMDPNSFFQSYRQREAIFDEHENSDDDAMIDDDNSDDGEKLDYHDISLIINE